MEECIRNVFEKEDGEYAAVGTYTVRWVDRLNKEKVFKRNEVKAMMGLMQAFAQGARGVMRVYTRACCDKIRNKEKLARGHVRALELRQLSIGDFVGQSPVNGEGKTEILKINPNYDKAYKLLGEIHYKKKEFDEAIVNLKKALKLRKEGRRNSNNIKQK